MGKMNKKLILTHFGADSVDFWDRQIQDSKIYHLKSSVKRNFTAMVHMLKRRCTDEPDNTGKLVLKGSDIFLNFSCYWAIPTELDHFTDFEMAQMQLHKQSQTDEVQVVSLARCWSVWQGLSEIPALLSVWAVKNHVKPVLVWLPAAPTIYGWSQGSCCSLA